MDGSNPVDTDEPDPSPTLPPLLLGQEARDLAHRDASGAKTDGRLFSPPGAADGRALDGSVPGGGENYTIYVSFNKLEVA